MALTRNMSRQFKSTELRNYSMQVNLQGCWNIGTCLMSIKFSIKVLLNPHHGISKTKKKNKNAFFTKEFYELPNSAIKQ